RKMMFGHRCGLLIPAGATHQHPFFHEKAAMTLTSSIEVGAWKAQSMGFEPKLAELAFSDRQATTLIAAFGLVPEAAPNKELAVSFLRIALEKRVQADISKTSGGFSVLPEVNSTQADPYIAKAIEGFESGEANCRFLHELFPAPGVMFEIEAELAMFWIGLEREESVASRLGLILGREIGNKRITK